MVKTSGAGGVENANTLAREEARKRTIDEVQVTEIFYPLIRSFYCLMLVNYFQMMMYDVMMY